jgi:hypothetical protein
MTAAAELPTHLHLPVGQLPGVGEDLAGPILEQMSRRGAVTEASADRRLDRRLELRERHAPAAGRPVAGGAAHACGLLLVVVRSPVSHGLAGGVAVDARHAFVVMDVARGPGDHAAVFQPPP